MKTIISLHKPTAHGIEEGDVWQHSESGETQVHDGTDFAPEGQTSLDNKIEEDEDLTDEEKAAEHARLEQERKDFEGQPKEKEKDNG